MSRAREKPSNLTRDPETRQTNGGQSVVAFGLAVSRQYLTARNEQREEVLFVDVEAWGRTGEVVAQYCRKGNPLFVEGRLKFDQWQDRDTGARRSRLSVTAESIQLLGAPDRGAGYGEESAGEGSSPTSPPRRAARSALSRRRSSPVRRCPRSSPSATTRRSHPFNQRRGRGLRAQPARQTS